MFAAALGFDFDLPDWPGYVWLLLIVAALAWSWKLGLLDKLRKIKSPVSKRSNKSYGNIPETLLPPGVIEMKKSNVTMKKQLDDAVAAETRRTVEEYTKLMALTASQTASLPLP